MNDGLLSTTSYNVFVSEQENYPWIQWHLPMKERITGVSVANSHKYGTRLKKIEVRAGTTGLVSTFKGQISLNKICGTFEGPGESDKEYFVKCDAPIFANYITVQINDTSSILQINELKYTTEHHVLLGN